MAEKKKYVGTNLSSCCKKNIRLQLGKLHDIEGAVLVYAEKVEELDELEELVELEMAEELLGVPGKLELRE